MAETNSTILERIWLAGTNDYQQRIPRETVNDMDATVQYLFAPENWDLYNMFTNALINRIGAVYMHQQAWRNPLAGFKKADLRWGDKLEEIAVKWIRSHCYSDVPDADKLFGDYRPEAATWFHKINRQEYYPISVNREELMMAFAGDGESEGLNNYIAQIMETPISSDEYDEYRIMLELFAYYDNKMGFYKRNLSAIPSDTTDSASSAKTLLKMVKADAGRLAFPSSRYHADIPELRDYPVFARPEELIFLTTPEVRAAIDVDALMSAFHMEKGEIQERVVLVDEFPMAGVGAVLTTRDFFQCRDRLRQNTSQPNALTLTTNFFLHRWGMYSVSPVAPAICYTTDEGTTILTSTQNVSGLTMTPDSANVGIGEKKQLTLALGGTISPTSPAISVQPDAAAFNVSITRAVATTAGVYTLTIGGTPANGDVVTAGIEGLWGVEVKLNATSAASVTTAAAAVKAAIEAATDAYTVTQSSGVLTLTENTGYFGYGTIVADVDTDTSVSPITAVVATSSAPTTATRGVNSTKTRVDRNAVLHVGDDLRAGDSIVVVASSAYINPSGDTTTYTATSTFTVV